MTPTPDPVTQAADLLRAQGWTVVAPVPNPQAGQTWTPVSASASARSVVATDVEAVSFLVAPGSFATSVTQNEWAAWVRRTNARPLPTPTPGAAP